MSPFLFAALAVVVLKSGCEITLLALARSRALRLGAGAVPTEARAAFPDDGAFRKAMTYSAAKSRDALVSEIWGAIVAVALIAGLAGLIHAKVGAFTGGGTAWREAACAVALFIVIGLADLPSELWSTFGTETKFGFNKSGPALWIADKLKGLAVGLVIGFALLTPFAWFLQKAPDAWWLFAWGVFALFQLLAAGLLTVVLLPLFNKLTPLADGELKSRLLGLAGRAGFAAGSVQVMDGSKRSAHANAFFAGFGRMRRIVLFDTLIAQLSPAELEAVLAHEIGHWKRGHIFKTMALVILGSLPVFAFAGWLSHRPDIFRDFGFAVPADATVVPFGALLPLLAIVAAPVLYWLAPFTNGLSRKHEYEADAYAAELTGGPEELAGALRKLYAANSGNPLPHPAYALFHHSHPTLPEREAAMNR